MRARKVGGETIVLRTRCRTRVSRRFIRGTTGSLRRDVEGVNPVVLSLIATTF